MSLQFAIAIRDGQQVNLKAEELVIGDIIECKFGDRVPADIRIISAQSFKVSYTAALFFQKLQDDNHGRQIQKTF